MNISVKNLSETRVEVTVVLDAEPLKAAEQVAIVKLSKNVKVPGFRNGKVPASVAAKNINPQELQEETLNNALSKAVAEAFIEEGIQSLERPAVEVKKYVPGEMLEFTAESEVIPKIKLGDYKKLKATSEKVSVTKKEIDEVIERMREGFAEKKSVKRAVQSGDEVVIDFVGKKDGTPFEGGTAKDYNLVIGSNSFIPGFEDAIISHKVGESFDIDLEFPADYHSKDLAGQKVVFSVTLNDIKEVVLPEVNDEFAAKAGPFTSAAEFTADIKRELTDQKEREASEKLKDDLVTQLVEKSEVPVPEILIKDQMQSIEQDFAQNLMYRGLTTDQYLEAQGFKDKDDWLKNEVEPTATKRVKAGLVLAELSKELKVNATSDELAQHIDLYKQQYQNNPQALAQFDEPEVQRDIANRLLTEKTVNQLLEINTK